MNVIVDTTPVNYLILIEEVDLLVELYDSVTIPQAVFDELSSTRAPAVVQEWIAKHPPWLQVRRANVSRLEANLNKLGLGEQEVIALADQLRADLVVMDDRGAWVEATRRGMRVIGTLGILDAAAEKGMLDISRAVERLRRTTFYVNPELLQALLDQHQKP